MAKGTVFGVLLANGNPLVQGSLIREKMEKVWVKSHVNRSILFYAIEKLLKEGQLILHGLWGNDPEQWCLELALAAEKAWLQKK